MYDVCAALAVILLSFPCVIGVFRRDSQCENIAFARHSGTHSLTFCCFRIRNNVGVYVDDDDGDGFSLCVKW